MKKLLVIFLLFNSSAVFVRGDPNIYGPGGVNLGPNGELPPSEEELQKEMLLEAERQKTRLLQDQVQQLQKQVQQLQQTLRQQAEMPGQQQYPVQIELNYGYPPQQNIGWLWGGPFLGSGFGGNNTFKRQPLRGGEGHRVGGDRGGHHRKGGRSRH
ncbi:MAG: hypothetical protein ACU84H_10835 [Gammaproteobacteria bacterium]